MEPIHDDKKKSNRHHLVREVPAVHTGSTKLYGSYSGCPASFGGNSHHIEYGLPPQNYYSTQNSSLRFCDTLSLRLM